jgi:3(or 17)beta-hydroxysteroid dehydrogenase
MGRIDGKVCLVTGGAMGLGKADAIVLAREGGRVVLTDVSEAGEKVAAEIGGDTMFLRHDVRDENQWQAVIAATLDRFGRLDVLVNNAGVIRLDTIETATLDDWRFVNAVNVEGTFLGCKHSIPAMRAAGGGSIINMSSTTAILGFPDAPGYTASKGAIQALTRAVAVYCITRGDQIRCNGVYPHQHQSPMAEANNPPEAISEMSSPFAVANAVLFLASDESADLNGTFLNLDRGTSCLVAPTPAGTIHNP